MKRIKSFEFRPGFGSGVESVDQMVNDHIRSLEKQGVTDIDLKIVALDRVVIYTLIWETSVKQHPSVNSPAKAPLPANNKSGV